MAGYPLKVSDRSDPATIAAPESRSPISESRRALSSSRYSPALQTAWRLIKMTERRMHSQPCLPPDLTCAFLLA
jgi:hypothetical protein